LGGRRVEGRSREEGWRGWKGRREEGRRRRRMEGRVKWGRLRRLEGQLRCQEFQKGRKQREGWKRRMKREEGTGI
jgi:hypothetical protein